MNVNGQRCKLGEQGTFRLWDCLGCEDKHSELSPNLNYSNSSYQREKQGTLLSVDSFYLSFFIFKCAQFLVADKLIQTAQYKFHGAYCFQFMTYPPRTVVKRVTKNVFNKITSSLPSVCFIGYRNIWKEVLSWSNLIKIKHDQLSQTIAQ